MVKSETDNNSKGKIDNLYFQKLLKKHKQLNEEREAFSSLHNKKLDIREILVTILVLIFLFGVHTRLILYLNENVYVPYYLVGISGLLLFLMNPECLHVSKLTPLIGLITIAAFSIALSPQSVTFLVERIKALLYFTYSLFLSYILIIELSTWTTTKIRKLFFYCMLSIMIGTLLETYTYFRLISDSFRESAYLIVYDSDFRDIAAHSGIRPKLFTSEPSWLAGSYVLVSTLWLLVSRLRKKYFIYFGFLLVMILIGRSPVFFVGLTNAVAIYLFHEGGLKKFFRNPYSCFYLLLIAVFAAAILYIALFTILEGRFQDTISGFDQSATLRLVTPMLIAVATISEFPFFGAGIGGKEAILPIILSIFNIHDINVDFLETTERLLARVGPAHTIANAFWEYWIVFGIIGGLLGIYCMFMLTKVFGCNSKTLFFVLFISFSMTTGAVGGVWIWTCALLLILVLRSEERVFSDHIINQTRKYRRINLGNDIPKKDDLVNA